MWPRLARFLCDDSMSQVIHRALDSPDWWTLAVREVQWRPMLHCHSTVIHLVCKAPMAIGRTAPAHGEQPVSSFVLAVGLPGRASPVYHRLVTIFPCTHAAAEQKKAKFRRWSVVVSIIRA